MTMGIAELKDKAGRIGIKRGDLVVVALLLAVSVVLMCLGAAGKQSGSEARVCVDGEQVALLSLDADGRYEVPGGCGNVLEISGGRVRMLSAECPDGSCVAQGYISMTGECIVCLPGRVTVTVVSGDGESELDAVAY